MVEKQLNQALHKCHYNQLLKLRKHCTQPGDDLGCQKYDEGVLDGLKKNFKLQKLILFLNDF